MNNFERANNLFSLGVVVVLYLLLVAIAGGNTYNADFNNYVNYYYNSDVSITKLDFGFYSILYIFYSRGVGYELFRYIFFGVTLFLLFRYIFKWAEVPIVCILFFILFRYVRDVVQIRNFCAFIILLSGLSLLSKQSMNSKMKFAGVVLLASTVHISFLVYFVLLLVKLNKRMNFMRICVVSILLAFTAHFVVKFISNYVFPYIESLNNKMDTYLFVNTYGGFSVSLFVIIVNIFVISYFSRRKFMEKYSNRLLNGLSLLQYDMYIYNVNVCLSSLLVLSLISSSFVCRLLGNFILINIIYITNKICFSTKKMFFADLFVFVFYVLFCVFTMSVAWFHVEDVLMNNFF